MKTYSSRNLKENQGFVKEHVASLNLKLIFDKKPTNNPISFFVEVTSRLAYKNMPPPALTLLRTTETTHL